jgi:hypothetical protein
VKKRVCLWLITVAHAPSSLAGSPNPRNIIQQLRRSAGSSKDTLNKRHF